MQALDIAGLRLGRAGPQKITISLPIQEGEAHVANNTAQRWVKVLSQKLKVAMIAGAPTWDYRSLRHTLSGTPWVQVIDAVAPAAGRITPQLLLEQDLVILSEVAPDTLRGEQWQAIRQLVHERGGSIILLPSTAQRQQAPGAVLRELAPYPPEAQPQWQTWPGQSPYYHAAPAAGQESLAALRLDDDADASTRRWDNLPAFYRYLALPQLKSGVRLLMVERESQRRS